MPDFQLHLFDYIAIGAYIVGIVALGLYFARNQHTSTDYFLAGRSLTWWLIGFSLFASNISSASLVGMAGEAYGTGIAVYNYEWMAAVVLIIFVIFFLPFYLRARIFTMPEFLERRFDVRSRYYFSGVTILGNILIDTAGALYAGALVIQMIFPEIPMWQSIVVLAVLAGLYTVAGGLAAVVYTDAIQAVLLLLGSIAISWLAFQEIGSWAEITAAVPEAKLSIIRPIGDPVLPWPGLLTGVFLLGFYFWTTNQFMVQRVLGAKDLQQGRWGALFAGALKLPSIFIMVLPGTFAIILYPGLTNPDLAYPTLLFDLMPIGIRGLLIAALIAAIMSSVDSTLNSASTLVTMDFVKKLIPDPTPQQLLTYGRITTFVFMILAAAWAPMILNFPSLWQYLQSVLAYLSPPIVACFVMGIFWTRANRHSAFAALIIGHLVALAMLITGPVMGLYAMHFLYIPPLLLVLCMAIIFFWSRAGEAPKPEHIEGYTWSVAFFREETLLLKDVVWYKNFRVQSVLLLIATAVLIFLFW
ncbi:MAG: sodium/solute symporter [Bacteroidetes bacterium]|nr:sodium/solute symporter [Bacteroidota bacterium]